MRDHILKDISSIITTGSMKRVVNANKALMFTVVKDKDPCPNDEVLEMEQSSQWGGKKKKIDISKEKISSSPSSPFRICSDHPRWESFTCRTSYSTSLLFFVLIDLIMYELMLLI